MDVNRLKSSILSKTSASTYSPRGGYPPNCKFHGIGGPNVLSSAKRNDCLTQDGECICDTTHAPLAAEAPARHSRFFPPLDRNRDDVHTSCRMTTDIDTSRTNTTHQASTPCRQRHGEAYHRGRTS